MCNEREEAAVKIKTANKKMMNDVSIKVFSKIAAARSYVNQLSKKAAGDMASDKKGQAILEYGILFVAVGLGLVFAVTRLKDTISAKLDEAGQQIQGIKSK